MQEGRREDESLWVLRAQYGDREALELLLRSVQPSLQRYLSGLVGSAHADDVLQEVLVPSLNRCHPLRLRRLSISTHSLLFPALAPLSESPLGVSMA